MLCVFVCCIIHIKTIQYDYAAALQPTMNWIHTYTHPSLLVHNSPSSNLNIFVWLNHNHHHTVQVASSASGVADCTSCCKKTTSSCARALHLLYTLKHIRFPISEHTLFANNSLQWPAWLHGYDYMCAGSVLSPSQIRLNLHAAVSLENHCYSSKLLDYEIAQSRCGIQTATHLRTRIQ